MSWLLLIVAGLLEVAWAASMKSTQGFTRLGPTLLSLVLMSGSFYLLGLAMRDLPTSSSYAVWVGIGAAGTALMGIVFLGESRSALRLISIVLIVLGVVGLRLAERG